jgi:hypothetical protein
MLSKRNAWATLAFSTQLRPKAVSRPNVNHAQKFGLIGKSTKVPLDLKIGSLSPAC